MNFHKLHHNGPETRVIVFVIHFQIFKTELFCSQKIAEYFLQNMFCEFLRVQHSIFQN